MNMENLSASTSASILTGAQQFINNNDGLWGFLALLILILGIILGWITGLFKFILGWFRKRLFNWLKPQTMLPTETLRFVPEPNQSFWGYGTRKVGKRKIKIIHASCAFYATNITRGNVLITSTHMKKPKRSDTAIPMVQEPPPRAHYWGRYPILSGHTTEVKGSYFLDADACQKGKELIADIIFTDQLGNDHLVRGVRLRAV